MKPPQPTTQGGYGLLLLLALLASASLVMASRMVRQLDRQAVDPATDAALRQAKEALIGYAASVDLDSGCAASNNCSHRSYPARPGDLPCPDQNNDGSAAGSCGAGASVTSQASRLGRLPWKTLGLPDLRDSSGERLWYAVSHNFKNNTRSNFLNSDTPGSITLRSADGSLMYDASPAPTGLPDDGPKPGSGVVAVIIAPGAALTRQDGLKQSRSAEASNNPLNYLDIALGEDNATFVDFSRDGFIAGPVRDAQGQLRVNDRILAITRDELMAAVEQRVAAETANCLVRYRSVHGAFPWPAPLSGTGFDGIAGTRFGRFPDNQIDSQGQAHATGWTTKPATNASGCLGGQAGLYTWWDNGWKNHVLIQLEGGSTLRVDGQAVGRGLLVIATGRALTGQSRPSSRVADYLEAGNADPSRNAPASAPAATFFRQPSGSGFNDRLAP